MPLQKEIIVLGDIEMGAGNRTDDFIAGRKLSSLIRELAKRKHPLDLVLNGDTFDFLKCPSQLQPHTAYPRHITTKVSLAKLSLICQAHADVFAAWKEFLASKNKHLYFILGNHDHDLIYPEVQEEIKRLLGHPNRTIIHPGSWRDEYDFNPLTRELLPRTKRYVRIKIIDDKPRYEIIDLPQQRSILYFDEVIKDESKYIQAAAGEEGFTRSEI